MWVRNNKGNIFVGNLPPDFTDDRLAEAFDPYGIVLTAAIARDPTTGAKLRYGFVDIATERAMAKAIAALNGSEIDGCKLNVKPRERSAGKKASPHGQRSPAPRPSARSSALNRLVHEAAEAPQRRISSPFAADARPVQVRHAESQSARSQSALEGLPQVEPPPRRDFEVVRRPVRRGTPSFQVERRPLPRRV